MGATGLPFSFVFCCEELGEVCIQHAHHHPQKYLTTLVLCIPLLTTTYWHYDLTVCVPHREFQFFGSQRGSVTSHVPVCGQFIYQLPAINTANPQQISICVAYVSGSQFVEHSSEHLVLLAGTIRDSSGSHELAGHWQSP